MAACLFHLINYLPMGKVTWSLTRSDCLTVGFILFLNTLAGALVNFVRKSLQENIFLMKRGLYLYNNLYYLPLLNHAKKVFISFSNRNCTRYAAHSRAISSAHLLMLTLSLATASLKPCSKWLQISPKKSYSKFSLVLSGETQRSEKTVFRRIVVKSSLVQDVWICTTGNIFAVSLVIVLLTTASE